MRAEQVTGPDAFHGEGPVWSLTWGGLRWVDMLAGDVLELDPTGGVARTHVGAVVAVIRPRRKGGAILALEDEFVVTDGPLSELRTVGRPAIPAGVRLNEGGCDPDGRFYCGSMAYDETTGAGTLYRLDADGGISIVLDQVTISNGFDFNPDRTKAYYVDTPLHRIDVFDYSADTGLIDRRTWVEVAADAGSPDGLVVDADGGVWLALMGGAAVHHYGADRRLDEVVEVPASQVTACTFGGPDLDQLYITTSKIQADPADSARSGALFVADCGVRGLPVLDFAG